MNRVKVSPALLVALVCCFGATNAWGQAGDPIQTLDEVDAFNTNVVLNMAFDDPNAPQDFTDLGIAGANLTSCKLTARGLYCLETDSLARQVVRQWPDTQKPLQFSDLLRCDDASIGLTGSRPCAGLTVDLSGAIWVTGTKADGAYSLVKVVPQSTLGGGCPGNGDWTVLASNATLCARQFATGAGVLADISAVDGEAGAAFGSFGAGILAVENGDTLAYFNLNVPGANPTRFISWGLASGTRLLSAALLQIPGANPGDPAANHLLAATNRGKILSKPAASPATVSQVFDITAWEQAYNPGGTSILIDSTTWGPCLSLTSCTVSGATMTANGGAGFQAKTFNGATGIGVAGGASGPEIDLGESVAVTFPAPRAVSSIQLLFLYNGPEFNDKAEKIQVATGQGIFTLTVRNTQDDAVADWSGPGSVGKCGATISTGSGCFLITNPFPAPVSSMTFTPLTGSAPFSGTGTNDSDFSIGSIETVNYGLRTSFTTGRAYLSDRDFGAVQALRPNAGYTALEHVRINNNVDDLTLSTLPSYPDGITVAPGNSFDLKDCSVNCALLKDANGVVTASLNNVKFAPGPSGAKVFQIKNLYDCRYVPQTCRILLYGATVPSDDTARQDLINAGWIQALDVTNKLKPAAERLNITPQLPEDVTSLFDSSGIAPNGLPPLYISNQYRGQGVNQFRFEALFFKTGSAVTFLDTLGGEIDVLRLAGSALGCLPVAGELRAWDVVATVSELYRSVGGRYIDTLTNSGCGTTQIVLSKKSALPYNLEVAPDTLFSGTVTVNNDAVFARLVQSLNSDLETIRRDFACTQADPDPIGGIAPLASGICSTLGKIWASGKLKLDKCIAAAFQPKASASNENCQSFRSQLTNYRTNLPVSASGPDPANRLGELKARVQVIFHVFDTRFAASIPPNGFCREKNTCPP